MTDLEKEAKVLEWCRSNPPGTGLPCMRESSAYAMETLDRKKCFICDNAKFSSPILFQGDSWADIYEQIEAKGESK